MKHLKNTHPDYTSASAADIVGRFNDVDMTLSYAAGSTVLHFSAPEIGIEDKTFAGATRKQSQDRFADWLKRDGIIGKIMKYQSEHSAASPITGAGGLLPSLAENDFDTGTGGTSNIRNGTDIATQAGNTVGIGAGIGSYTVGGSEERVETLTLPLSYARKTGNDPREKLIVSVPASIYRVGSAKGYHAGLGLAYRIPVTEHWTLTPGARYAVPASADRASVASVVSGSLTSNYTVPLGGLELNIGNMIGYYGTGKFKAGDYSFNPHIRQTIVRNGLMLSQPVTVKNKKLAVEYSVIDTRYLGGRKPFMNNMQEYGVTVGTHKDTGGGILSSMRGGITYKNAKGAHGFAANFGCWF